MLKEESDGLGGEKAGVRFPLPPDKDGPSTHGGVNAMAAIWISGHAWALGTRKSWAQEADVSWGGASCRWHGGTAELQSTDVHEAVHCKAPKISPAMSMPTSGTRVAITNDDDNTRESY